MRRYLFPVTLLAVSAWVALAQPPSKTPRAPSAGTAVQPGEVRPGSNMVRNGDFEEGTDTPAHWQQVDGLSTFWVKDSDPVHGKVLKFDTDVLQSQGYEWWTEIRSGRKRAKDAPAKLPTVEPKYDTLAGLDGVWYWSDYIPIKKGRAYWLSMDVKGPAILVWLFGYADRKDMDGTILDAGLSAPEGEALQRAVSVGDVPAQRRLLEGKLAAERLHQFIKLGDTSFGGEAPAFLEKYEELTTGQKPDRGRGFKAYRYHYIWKGQMPAGGDTNNWRTYSRIEQPFRPTNNTPTVRYVRVMLYPYWPPGEYFVDNVRLVEYDDGEDE